MANHRIRSRILVIDDEERVREDLCAMFRPQGYDVEVVTGLGSALIANARSQAKKFRPHVAIVDLRLLLNEADRSGIKLIEDLGPAHCILYSSYITPEISLKLANFKTAGWAAKEDDPQNLVDLVNRVAKDASASQKNFRIRKSSISFEKISHTLLGKGIDIPPLLIEDILCQLFPDTSGVNVETLEGSVKTPTSVNRGRSAILKVNRKDRIQPLIVKVARQDDISREYENYKRYIEGNLNGNFNAILSGEPKTFWDLGAVVYSFLGSSNQSMSEFSIFYKKEQDSDAILRPLHTFFGEVWYGLYSRENRGISTPLYSAYDKFLKLQKRLTNFLDQKEYRAFRGLDINLLNPVAWVLKHKTDSMILNAHQAITHGDLHGDNMFVDGTHAWVIDFERSGWGHILRDFAELEMDIVTRLAWKKDNKELKELFLLINHLVAPNYLSEGSESTELLKGPELRKAFNVIRGLRQIAQNITKFNDFREYVWSLLFDAVFVATHTEEGEPQHERALLYGSVLCSRLQHWGEAWPPEEWKPVLAGIQSGGVTPAKTASSPGENSNPDSVQVAENNGTVRYAVASQLPGAESGFLASGSFPDPMVDFVLVTALPEERDALLGKLPGHRQLRPTEDDIRTYFQADLPIIFPDNSTGRYRVVVMCLLGMGRVQAVTATMDAIRRWQPRYILMVGIAGGLAAGNVHIGDILISDQIVDYELQKLTPLGPEIRWDVQRADPRLLNACNNYINENWQELIQVKRPDKARPQRHTGPIASGDKVIAFDEVLTGYRDVWPKLIGVEMEAAGVATAAFQSSRRSGFFMIRGVSDLADMNKDSTNVKKWRKYACDIAASYTIALLKSGPIPLTDDSTSLKTR